MMNEATAISNMLAIFVATYLFHSTILLSACWLFLRLSRATSHFLIERLWKLAAVMGLFTTLLHMACGGIPARDATGNQAASPGIRAENGAVAGILAGAETMSGSLENDDNPENEADDAQVTFGVAGDPIDSTIVERDPTISVPTFSQLPEARLVVESESHPVALLPDSTRIEPDRQFQLDATRSNLEVASAATGAAVRVQWPRILRWISPLASALLIGCVVCGGAILVIQSFRLRTRFATSRPLKDGPARQAIERFLRRNRIRRSIWLLTSAEHHEPVTYGLFVWTIVLPRETEDRLGKEELKALLAHEIAHLARGDVWWLWIGRFLCTCLVFQPLNLLARRQWQQAAEYLCDDWAVERGVRSISLARCLTQIAEWRFGKQVRHVGLAAGGTKATLVKRVERLVKSAKREDAWAKPWRRRLLTAAAFVVAIALAGLTPRFALPFNSAAQSRALDGVTGLSDSDAARIDAEWQRVEEELLQLDADLDQASVLLRSATDRTDLTKQINGLNRQAAAMRARRTHITSFIGKEPRR